MASWSASCFGLLAEMCSSCGAATKCHGSDHGGGQVFLALYPTMRPVPMKHMRAWRKIDLLLMRCQIRLSRALPGPGDAAASACVPRLHHFHSTQRGQMCILVRFIRSFQAPWSGPDGHRVGSSLLEHVIRPPNQIDRLQKGLLS